MSLLPSARLPHCFALILALAVSIGAALDTQASGPNGKTVAAVPTNVLTHSSVAGIPHYNPEGAALGSNVVVAREEQAGFRIKYSVSNDGGASFTDMGDPPVPAGYTWRNDPQLTVNEKTGQFWLIGQVRTTSPTRVRIASIRGSFSGTTLAWGTPTFITPEILSPFYFTGLTLDAAADSSSGNIYFAWNNYYTTSSVELYRSVDGGATWSGPLSGLPASATAATVEKLINGPDGALYILGDGSGTTAGRLSYIGAVSLNPGAPTPTWSAITVSPDVVLNNLSPLAGSGAPSGFAAECDRTLGTYRGRIYAAWQEPYAFDTQPLPSLADPNLARVEVEPNDTPNDANPITTGIVLRGNIPNPGDLDYFRLTLAAGDHVIFSPDSLPAPGAYLLECQLSDPSGQSYGLALSDGAAVRPFTFVAPHAGDYYMSCKLISGASLGAYRIRVAIGTGGALFRDQRDIALSYSDDHGATWSTPVRLNDSNSGFDDVFPTLQVAGDGCPYVTWNDHRDDPSGTLTNIYVTRSPDGGNTWPAAAPISNVISNWTPIVIAGSYPRRNALVASGETLHAAWSDARGPQVDVYAASWSTGFAISGCNAPAQVHPGTTVAVGVTIENQNIIFGHDYAATVTDQRAWPLLPQAAAAIGAGATKSLTLAVAVPDTAAPGINTLTLHVKNAKGTIEHTCTVPLDVENVTAVGDGHAAFRLDPSHPNPARGQASIPFQLAARSHARLVIYGLRGELVRTLVDDVESAGSHTVVWDERDAHGLPAGPGLYYYRLDADGRTAMRPLVLLR